MARIAFLLIAIATVAGTVGAKALDRTILGPGVTEWLTNERERLAYPSFIQKTKPTGAFKSNRRCLATQMHSSKLWLWGLWI
jgi:hypothetical protein